MQDFLLEARDEGLIQFITDNGGGGLSSSIGESARFSNGCEVYLENVPLKYEGLDQWEIWVSESQERMTVAVRPEDVDRFMALSGLHEVESTVIGRYTDTGRLHVTYDGRPCAFIRMDLLKSGFPQWKFEAQWQPAHRRGLFEPVIKPPRDYETLVLEMLSRPNVCSKEWIVRQYDHEVQGTSVIKPLVGKYRDISSDAVVIRPVLDSNAGLAFSQALLPGYSAIDAYHMTACTIDEAVRRVVSVGGNPEHIGGVDNFCWPDIAFDPRENPDGKFKAAQLVRSCRALADTCRSYGIPLLSGKDSMYVDGHLPGRYGETHKVCGPETIQFSAISAIEDITKCVTMDCKVAGDAVFVLGMTRDELGGSEYYDHFGYIGLNVPRVSPDAFSMLYHALHVAICNELIASAHGIYRGGLGVHGVLTALGGNVGMTVDLSKIPSESALRPDTLLFSESAGRFIVTVAPEHVENFRKLFKGLPCAEIGRLTEERIFEIRETARKPLGRISLDSLKSAWKRPFGDL
jgi:phosphoribosylformylglycinamidine synthase